MYEDEAQADMATSNPKLARRLNIVEQLSAERNGLTKRIEQIDEIQELLKRNPDTERLLNLLGNRIY